jgi:hypothetical protein
MNINNNYPKINKFINKFIIFRKVALLIFLISIIACTIINIAVGGKIWMLYVIGGEIIFYYTFLNKPLIDNTFVKRFTVVVLIVCAYLYLIDIIDHTHWSYFVITIIGFGILLTQLTLFFSAYKNSREKFIPMFWTSIGSLIICLLAIVKVIQLNWPIIVIGSLALFIFLVLFFFFRKTLIGELKKYFNIN